MMTDKKIDGGSGDTPVLSWTDDLVRRFWNYYAQFPHLYFASLYGTQIADVVSKSVPSGVRVLDYGCGTGALTGYLLHSGFLVTACDFSPDSVSYTEKIYASYRSFMGASTIDVLCAKNEVFDAIVLVEVIEHLDAESLSQVMKNLRALLAPGGVAILTTPNDEDLHLETVYCPSCNHTFHRWQHVRSWNSQTLSAYVNSFGFEVVAMKEMDLSLSRKEGFIKYLLRRFLRVVRGSRRPHLVAVIKTTCEEEASH